MAYTKRVWKGRQGTGLNKFSIDGATPVTIVNQPDSVTEQGDALSAGNLNDLETRIDDAFNAVDAEVATKADETEVTDLKNAIDANSNRISNLEQEHGGYVTVNYRGTNAVPTGKAKYALVESIVGKSRAWNQLCKNGNFESQSAWSASNSSYSVSDNVGTVTANSTNAFYIQQSLNLISGHTYLFSCDVKASNATMQLRISNAYGGSDMFAQKNTNWQTLTTKWTGTLTASLIYPNIYANDNASGDSFQVKNVILRDLTLIFPEGVPSTVAECVQKCPDILKYDSYGQSLVDTTVEGVRAWARNLWDEVYEEGDINYNTGVPQGNSNYIRSVNFCKVTANTSIYVKGNNTIWLLWYDANYGYLGGTNQDGTAGGTVVTSPANARYFKLVNRKIVFDGKICINISDSQNGTYTPYHAPQTLSLPSPITLRSAGTVAEEFDLKTGEKTNPLGSVDLGTLTWGNFNGVFYATLGSGTFPVDTSNLLCARYITASPASLGQHTDKTIFVQQGATDGTIVIDDRSYNNANTLKSDLDGVYLYYELATPNAPTQLDPIQDPTILTEGGGTTNTIQTQTPVIDNSMDVGYLAL